MGTINRFSRAPWPSEKYKIPVRKNEDIAQSIITNILSLKIPDMHTERFVIHRYFGIIQQKVLLASVSPAGVMTIYINPEWAYHILYYWDKRECRDAFRITIGHEHPHKYDLHYNCKNIKQKNFIK